MSTCILSPFGRRRGHARTATPVTNIASVESMNGAPRIAPTPIARADAAAGANRIAMIGIIVSGSAVPTAASTDPTAPSASSSFRPNHSMPLVNSSAPARMTTNATTRISMSISGLTAEARTTPTRDHHEHADGDRAPCAGRRVRA